MKLENQSERHERLVQESKIVQVPGRTLPKNCQWTGMDQLGCGAAKRRLRQAAALEAKRAKQNEVEK